MYIAHSCVPYVYIDQHPVVSYYCNIDLLGYLFLIFIKLFISGELISFCPGQSKALSCVGPRDVIVFQSALWGRTFGNNLCGFSPPQEVCASNSTMAVLTKDCFRSRSCFIDYSSISTNFRDPCPAAYTELILDYLCVPGKICFIMSKLVIIFQRILEDTV